MAYAHRLDDDERRELLSIARETLRQFTVSGSVPPGAPDKDSLLGRAGAFVTLRSREGALRGCIGTQEETTPLYQTVQQMAIAAATRDPRFGAVSESELDDLVIEISVLGERGSVSRAEDVTVGQHGLSIQCSGRRGLLLPQVAREHGWTASTFLSRVCAKAGLPEDAWSSADARVERFTAQVFEEG
jgi:hypothetical protein